MKNLILFFLVVVLAGCEKDFDTVVQNELNTYQVKATSFFDSFAYNDLDSNITVTIVLSEPGSIQSVYCDIYSSANEKLNTEPLFLYDNGNPDNGDLRANDAIYSNRFPLSQYYPNGKYTIYYYITDLTGSTSLPAIHSFIYDNAQENFAPVISNLNAPDTVESIDEDLFILITIEAEDENGLIDIESVYFNSFLPPNYTQGSSGNPFIMWDDGNASHGDEVEGDGIYSIIVLVPAGTDGRFKWVFQARDRGDKLSNEIVHFIEVL
ncbi:MAG: hypothetical protein Kow0098_28690 [Ignavibacteriaceae bacterium]